VNFRATNAIIKELASANVTGAGSFQALSQGLSLSDDSAACYVQAVGSQQAFSGINDR
jgi:hypothetical protein